MTRPLRAIVESLCETVEREVRIREDRATSPGGQHVPNHGDFAGLPPSAMIRLARWSRDLREALAAEPPNLLAAIERSLPVDEQAEQLVDEAIAAQQPQGKRRPLGGGS